MHRRLDAFFSSTVPLPHSQDLAAARWTVRPAGDLSRVPAAIAGRVIPATIPGCIHTDLIDAGLIRDPRIGDAEAEVQWVSWTDWRYEAEFDADPALLEREEIDLVFDQLDTIAAIELNGVEVGRAASEFLPHRFSVLGLLTPGKNRLAVTFTSPLRYVQEEAARLGPRPVNGDYPAYNMIRKCASNFEWDWGPRVATCGIAGDVRLEGWDCVRIADLRSRTEVCSYSSSDNSWQVAVDVQLAWSRGCSHPIDLCLELDADGPSRAEATVHPNDQPERLSVMLKNPTLWSPIGYGEQRLYATRIDLLTSATPASGYDPASRRPLDSRRFATGVRRSQPASWFDADDFFPLVINHDCVYCRGANWIPEGLFPRDRPRERVRHRLEQLKAANMNMVRVWGGGRYEPDWFYDICDELGIMVWQDFMLACACYPEEEPIRSLIEAEARHHVARLSRHPSVVLWCGGNECTWAHQSWGFKEKLAPGQTWGEKYYNEILPRVCREENPSVPYIPNSPFSPGQKNHPNDPSQGDAHVWEVWGDGYRTVRPRFCSEFGQQAPSNHAALKNASLLDAEGLVPRLLAARQRGPGGNKRWYDDPIAAWFRPPRDFDEWHYLAQLLQARSLSIGIEWQRANMPHCMGSLIWQLNDAWPGLSWSLIDSEGKPKLAYHAVAAAFKNRKLTFQPMDGGLHVVAINDTNEPWSGQLRLRRMTFDGSEMSGPAPIPFSLAPREATRLCRIEELVGAPSHPDRELLVADALGHRATWYYLPDRELRYPQPVFSASIVHDKLTSHLHIEASVLIRDLRILGATSRLTTLLPGESLDVHLYTGQALPEDRGLDASRFTSRPAFSCANHFGKPPIA